MKNQIKSEINFTFAHKVVSKHQLLKQFDINNDHNLSGLQKKKKKLKIKRRRKNKI